MLEAQRQQHLKTLRRGINRAIMALNEGGKVVCHSGWGYGFFFSSPWLAAKGRAPCDFDLEEDTALLLPSFGNEEVEQWSHLIDESFHPALRFFWPGPLQLRVRLEGGPGKLNVACPWHPIAQEILTRYGPLLWRPIAIADSQLLKEGSDFSAPGVEKARVLIWPEKETPLRPTIVDAGSRPWRLVQKGFVEFEELQALLESPLVLTMDRAFPARAIRTYIPQGRTIVVEAEFAESVPEAVLVLRQQIPPDTSLRIYLDESIAHTHFPDDREVRVYGELTDLERVRRRLQAMLERQRKRLGKRLLLVAVSGLGEGAESFRADLEKLSDGWIHLVEGQEPRLDAV